MSGPQSGAPSPPPAIDARGLLCPQPVLLLARAAKGHPGQVITVWADDPAADTDIPAWCVLRGAELRATRPLPDGGTEFVVAIPSA